MMTEKSSFSDRERAAWLNDRRHKSQDDADTGVFAVSGNTCIHCGTPLRRDIPNGYEAALCDACD
jgi:formamidopyrimidine-DNA glycosylase